MGDKKGLFYTIDAFIAFGILSAGVILFLSGFSFESSSGDPQFRVDYVKDLFSSTLLSDINSDYVVDLIDTGDVDSESSVFQQTVVFHHGGGDPTSFFGNVSDDVFDFDDGYNYAVFVDSEKIFSSSGESSFENSDFVFVSRVVIVGKSVNPVGIAGPSLVEVFLWL